MAVLVLQLQSHIKLLGYLPEKAQILYSLDPYNIRCLKSSEVEQLQIVCSELQLMYKDNKFMTEFFESLLKLCSTAYQQEKKIMAVGD